MKRTANINALISKSNRLFDDLKDQYVASLHEKFIRDDLKIDIKNIFENLRASLDYLARDIFEYLFQESKKPDRLYFPVRQSANGFRQAIKESFPDIENKLPEVFQILEKFQPYNDPWLKTFNDLNNNNKHQDLSEQVRLEERYVTVQSENNNGIEFIAKWGPGVKFSNSPNSFVKFNGVLIDPLTQLPKANNRIKTEVETWVDFVFRENNVSILPFIAHSIEKVDEICKSVNQYISAN